MNAQELKEQLMTSSELQKQLPDLNPSVLQALDASQQQTLLSMLKTAGKQQEQDYANALDEGLKHVPALLRKTVRKMILG